MLMTSVKYSDYNYVFLVLPYWQYIIDSALTPRRAAEIAQSKITLLPSDNKLLPIIEKSYHH